jgi:hypothetical protein
MHHPRRRSISLLLALLLLVCAAGVGSLAGKEVEQATIYPSYGYRSGARWLIPLRIWVHEPRRLTETAISLLVASGGDRPVPEIERFQDRVSDLVADDESREQVAFVFDKDPRAETFTLREADGTPKLTDLNGLIVGELQLTTERARGLLKAQSSSLGWLRLHVVSPGHRGSARLRLIEPQGLSVISDIDDTIKVTNIPAGGKVVIENTFYRPFVAAPGMAERYRRLGEDAAFHYVSGGSWQLYRPLAGFIAAAGYPEGSFHMKSVRKNLLTAGSWRDLWKLARGDATVEQKLGQISGIVGHFPQRRFILVGDSGELDPEVYKEIRSRFPRQIEAIWIRDLIDDRHRNPERLRGMQIIDAE